jgi:hypothetical protein
MKYRNRVEIKRASGMTSFKLSKLVAELDSSVFSGSGNASTRVRKAVMRALADRYPNIFPSVETLAHDAGYGPTQTRYALRDLESAGFIQPLPDPNGRTRVGGARNTVQYVIDVQNIKCLVEAQRERQLYESENDRLPSVNPPGVEPNSPDLEYNAPPFKGKAPGENANPPHPEVNPPILGDEHRREQRKEKRRGNREEITNNITAGTSGVGVAGATALNVCQITPFNTRPFAEEDGTPQETSVVSDVEDSDASRPQLVVPSAEQCLVPSAASALDPKQRPLDRREFMAVLQKLWRDNTGENSLETTPTHREEAFAMANQNGQRLFVAAWDHCLRTDGGSVWMFKFIPGRIDPLTGRMRDAVREPRKWPLQYFIDSGLALLHMNLVKPYGSYCVSGKELAFLVYVQKRIRELEGTDRPLKELEIAELLELMKRHDIDSLEDVFKDHYNELEDFIVHADDYIRQSQEAVYLPMAETAASIEFDKLPPECLSAVSKLGNCIGWFEMLDALMESGPWKEKQPGELVQFCEEACNRNKRLGEMRNPQLGAGTLELETTDRSGMTSGHQFLPEGSWLAELDAVRLVNTETGEQPAT